MKKNYFLNYLIYTILQWTWGIFQNILGLALWIILNIKDPKRKKSYYHGAILTEWSFPSSMGLGMFIYFGHKNDKDGKAVLVHEYGHTLQSIFLGPLFFPIIAIPSCTWAFIPVFVKWRKEGRYRYTQFYPERWANIWGEAVLKEKAPDR